MSRRPRFRFSLGNTQISQGALYLLFANAGFSLIFALGTDEMRAVLAEWLIATADGGSVWGEWKVWQLFTSPLIEPRFISLILNAFMLWFFLPTLERWWGMKRFLFFAGYTSVFGTFVGTLVGLAIGSDVGAYPIAGLTPFVFAGIVAYGILFASQPVRLFGALPMTGRQLTIGILAFTAVFIVLGQQWASGASIAAAIALAWFMTSDKASPRLWWLKRKQKKVRKHLKLVKTDDSKKRWVN